MISGDNLSVKGHKLNIYEKNSITLTYHKKIDFFSKCSVFFRFDGFIGDNNELVQGKQINDMQEMHCLIVELVFVNFTAIIFHYFYFTFIQPHVRSHCKHALKANLRDNINSKN